MCLLVIDWIEGGWNVDDMVVFLVCLCDMGVDLVDVFMGGNLFLVVIFVGFGY